MEDVAAAVDYSFSTFEAEVAQRKHQARAEHIIAEHPKINAALHLSEYRRNPFRKEKSNFVRRFLDLVVDAMRMKGMTKEMLARNIGKSLPFITSVLNGDVDLELDDMVKILLCIKRRFKVGLEELTPDEKRAVDDWASPGNNNF